ncbi:MAG TPA: hypothetical protein VFN75_09565 [Pseudonocardiaceae bacterium]|nr:hypothetical protein [Pseudonocardiaceae bacterium]
MAAINDVRNERWSGRTAVVPVTSALDGFEHLVADAAMAPGNAGRYAALCGRDMWAAALACPAGPRCLACVVAHDADGADRRRHRRTIRRGTWARLASLLRCSRPVPSQFSDIALPPSEIVPSPLRQNIQQ